MSERWKPEDEQKYYFVSNMLTVGENTYMEDCEVDRFRYGNGNCFKTQAEAESAAKKVKALLLSLHDSIQNKSLPKLTAEVFNHPDCPAWAKWAAVDGNGYAYYYSERPFILSDDFGWRVACGKNTQCELIPGKFTHINRSDSLIERPEELPEWVEIGGYVYDARNGYGKIVSGSVKSCYIEFDGGAGDFVPEAFAELKQARLRKYTTDEMKALVGKVLGRNNKTSLVIACLGGDLIRADEKWLSSNRLIEECYTLDGKPCGVLEHLNENGEWVE